MRTQSDKEIEKLLGHHCYSQGVHGLCFPPHCHLGPQEKSNAGVQVVSRWCYSTACTIGTANLCKDIMAKLVAYLALTITLLANVPFQVSSLLVPSSARNGDNGLFIL
jgi:hypothetical protein